MTALRTVALLAIAATVLSGCESSSSSRYSRNDPGSRALIGGLIGAGLGAGIGAATGGTALSGAGYGAGAGMLVGILSE